MPSSSLPKPDWRVVEGIAGTWHYHVRDAAQPNANLARGACGAEVMHTLVPLSAWGHVGHLKERWCSTCAKHAGLEKNDNA